MNLERQWIEQLQRRSPQIDLLHDTFYDQQTRQILTTDLLIEGVHFSWDYFTPFDTGWRAIAVSLSDIAATGGVAKWVLVSIGISPEDYPKLNELYQGMKACCDTFHCQIVGGDTVRATQTTLNVSILGTLPIQSQVGRRNTAKTADILTVSGDHGLSRAGLEILKQNGTGYSTLTTAHLRPNPPLKLGQSIAQVVPRFAMMDSSDGLADAVCRLAEASGVDIIIEAHRVTIHPQLKEVAEQYHVNPLDWVLYGGEDFHLVVSLSPETIGLFPELHPIGAVQPPRNPGRGQGYLLEKGTLKLLDEKMTFQHFEPEAATLL